MIQWLKRLLGIRPEAPVHQHEWSPAELTPFGLYVRHCQLCCARQTSTIPFEKLVQK